MGTGTENFTKAKPTCHWQCTSRETSACICVYPQNCIGVGRIRTKHAPGAKRCFLLLLHLRQLMLGEWWRLCAEFFTCLQFMESVLDLSLVTSHDHRPLYTLQGGQEQHWQLFCKNVGKMELANQENNPGCLRFITGGRSIGRRWRQYSSVRDRVWDSFNLNIRTSPLFHNLSYLSGIYC